MDFIAFDFETPNGQNSAPCSLGITLVENNIIQKCFSFLINPEQPFNAKNTELHGISANDVADAPKFPEVWEQVVPLFRHYPVVAHNATFDKLVLEKVTEHYGITLPNITYYCTMKLYKHNFPNLPGFSLDSLCEFFNLSLENHHCCSDDSNAAAELMIILAEDLVTSIFPCAFGRQSECIVYDKASSRIPCEQKNPSTSWQQNYFAARKLDPIYEESTVIYDEPDSIIFTDKTFVVTGDVEGFTHEELERIISRRGGQITSINRKLNYLIVGMQNKNLIKDTAAVKSQKIIKAEKLREDGYPIKIISDEFFLSQIEVQCV